MIIRNSALAALSFGTLLIATPSALAQNTTDSAMDASLPADDGEDSDEGKWGMLGLLGLAGLLGMKRKARNHAADSRAEATQRG